MDQEEQSAVYGTDGRKEVYDHTDAMYRTAAKTSSVAIMYDSLVNESNPSNVTFLGNTLGASYNLCAGERFINQTVNANCSGTLIGDDLVLTAGQCVTGNDCSGLKFVFGYYKDTISSAHTVTSADVFTCTDVVVRRNGTSPGDTMWQSYAILRLDRPATPRFVAAKARRIEKAAVVDGAVANIGYPSGIMAKIDSTGKVRSVRAAKDWFTATTDTFSASYGSPLYEVGSNVVVGIHGVTEQDYEVVGSCSKPKACAATGCSGERYTYAWRAMKALCDAHPTEPACL